MNRSVMRSFALPAAVLCLALAAHADEAEQARPAAPMLDVANAASPLPGVLVGGQPSEATMKHAAEAGYRTIVNLRPEAELGARDEEAEVTGLGMRYVGLPVAAVGDLTEPLAESLAAVLRDPASYPVLVHCASGNRVGGLFAVKAFRVDGESIERALAAGRDAGLTRLEPAVRKLLEAANEE